MEGRLPYPLDERGVPVKPLDLDVCYDVCLRGIFDTNRHHLAFERRSYKGAVERGYRESGSMIVKACVCKHASLHETYLPPKKPSISVMRSVANGEITPTETEIFIRSRELVNLENTA